jgi:hypothetical protein
MCRMQKLCKTQKVTNLKDKSKKCYERTTKTFDTSCKNIWNPKNIHPMWQYKLRPRIIKTKQRSRSLQLINTTNQGKTTKYLSINMDRTIVMLPRKTTPIKPPRAYVTKYITSSYTWRSIIKGHVPSISSTRL